MELGISSYTFGWAIGVPGFPPPRPMDEHGLLGKAAEFGAGVVQICDNLPLHLFSPARLDSLAARAAQQGVRLELGAKRLSLGHIETYAGIARHINADLIRFVVDAADYHPAPPEIVKVLRDALPVLGELTLAVENHDRLSAAVLRRIIDDVGDPRVGICLDTANSLGAGEGLEAVTAALAPVTVNLHLKDFQIMRVPYLMGFEVAGRPAGRGMLEVPTVLQSLAPFGRCRTAISELWVPPERLLEETLVKEAAWAKESFQFLRGFLP